MAPAPKPENETPVVDVAKVATDAATTEATKVATDVAKDIATNTPTQMMLVAGEPMTSDDFAKYISEKMETLVVTAIRAKAGPVAAFGAQQLVGMLIAPIVESLVAVVSHIGMAVPNALETLVERLEDKTGWDLNGDGHIGDPDVGFVKATEKA